MINLRQNTIVIGTDEKEVTIDIRAMMANIYDTENTKDAGYFNATPLAKIYGKEVYKFMELGSTKKFIAIWDKNNALRKKGGVPKPTTSASSVPSVPKPNIYSSKSKGDITYINNTPCKVSNQTNLSYTIVGGDVKDKLQGTYMQTRLFFRFLRWLDMELEVMLDMFFMDLVCNINTLKKERKGTIEFFHELIEVSDKYYVPKQSEGYPQEYANQKLMELINIECLGCSSHTYKKRHNITDIETRAWLTPQQLTDIKKAEAHVIGMIKYAKIYDYKTLKSELHDMMVNDR